MKLLSLGSIYILIPPMESNKLPQVVVISRSEKLDSILKYSGMAQKKNHYNKGNKMKARQTQSKQGQPRVLDDIEHKAVWANYLNMARQNMYQIACHITHVLGLAYDPEDKELEANLMQIPAVTLLGKGGKAEQKQKAMKMFDKHFPFLTPMLEKYIERHGAGAKEKTPKMYYEIMNMILPLINLYRNKYTHYKLEDSKLNEDGSIADANMLQKCKELSVLINYNLEGACQIVKKRWSVGKKAALKEEKDHAGAKPADRSDTGEKITFQNSDFDLLIKNFRQERKVAEIDFKYNVFDAAGGLSNVGLFMLVCLLLEKKYASEFADQVDFFGKELRRSYQPTQVEIAIMREVISMNHIRLPKKQLQSTSHASALGLDMLNELKKCPRELFDTLSPADQAKFRVKVEDEREDEILLLRSQDRFPTLALRYIDSAALFRDIRFQVQLGNYRYKFYRKEWIDQASDDERIRILQKELTGYGRLEEIEKARNEKWGDLIRKIDEPRQDTLQTEPYVSDHHASYLFNNNRIGLLWNTEGYTPLRNQIFMPSLTLPSWLCDYPAKAAELRNSDKKANEKIAPCVAPLCWLSIYELPAVIFLSILTGSGEKAEGIIKKTVANYRRLFADVWRGELKPSDDISSYGIDFKHLPRKIQDYLAGKEVNIQERFITLGRQKLDRMLEDTRTRLKYFLKNKERYASGGNTMGKNSHVDLRPGTLARYLSNDLMFFKKADENRQVKVTGQNFTILQAELAQYPKPNEQLPDGVTACQYLQSLLQRADLIEGDSPHPFLPEVMKKEPTTFYQLYEIYLSHKIEYIEKKCKTLDDKALSSLHFLYPQRKKWAERDPDFYKELAMRYITIELPHGLFLPAIKEALLASPVAKNLSVYDALVSPTRPLNVTFLIAEYFKALGDKSQTFYGNTFKRYYKYLSMIINPQWDFTSFYAPLVKKYYSVSEMANFQKQIGSATPEGNYEKREIRYQKELEKRADKRIRQLDDERRKQALTKDQYEVKKQGIKKELSEEMALIHDFLKKYRAKYSENEKTIRRYKVQDMLLFLMAKNILTESMRNSEGVSTDFSAYKLRYIGEHGDKDILSLRLPFSIVLEMDDKKNPVRRITIKQADLKLKNYGDFFSFIYDSRIRSLLLQVKQTVIDRSIVEKELDNYNQERIPMFEVLHALEGKIWQLFPDGLPAIGEGGEPIKIDFKYLIQFIDLKKCNKDLVCAIRNAFSHSNYPTDPVVARNVFDKVDLPEVANELAHVLRNKTRQVKLKKTVASSDE